MRKINFTITLFFLTTLLNFSYGKQNAIDSLENLLKAEKSEIEQIKILNSLFDEEFNSNYNKSLQYASLALRKSKGLENNDANSKLLAESYNNVGISYLLLADYDNSLKNLLASLQVAESIKDTVLMSNAISNIGTMYGYKGELDKAYDYFVESAELDEKSGNLAAAATSYSNLTAYYFGIADKETGQVYYDKAMKIFKNLEMNAEIANLYVANAMMLRQLDNHKEALKYYDLAISIYKEEKDLGSLVPAYINVSSLYLAVNKRKKAEEFGKLALEMAIDLNSPDDIMLSYSGLSDTYEKMGKPDKALYFYKKSNVWKDTIYNQKSAEAIAEMTAKYNLDKEERVNKILKQEAAINELEIENNQKKIRESKLILNAAIGGAILLVLLALVLFNRNKIKQKANDKLLLLNNNLLEANNIIEEKNRDITSSIEYAQYIQQAILPKKSVVAEAFNDSFLMLLPKDLVSGDFYWFQKYGKYSVLVMADCTGHGVPGGFMSMMGAEMLNQVLIDPEIVDAGVALGEIDKRIKNNLNQVGSVRQQNDGMDLALCIFNIEEKVLQYSGANRPLVLVRDHELIIFKPNKFGVGGSIDEVKEFQTQHIEIKKGDAFYMYSDGYPDQFGGPKNKKFMKKKLNSLILEQSSFPMGKQEKVFLDEFNDWKGEMEQIDDVCLIGVKI